MHALKFTPSIEVSIGRETRLYHAFITTAPITIDAPATVTIHIAPLWDVVEMAADPVALDPARARVSARLVLVDATQLETEAAPPETAVPLYEEVVRCFRAQGVMTRTGQFGAMMQVDLINDGPVTLILDSK
jgi:hypothetical protein